MRSFYLFTLATTRSQPSLFVALAAGLWCFSAGCHVKSLPLPSTPSQTEAKVCSTMGESIRSSSFYNPTLSTNKHAVQICRFSLSAAANLTDGSRGRRTSPFNGDAQRWNGIERSLSRDRAVVPQISARFRFDSVVFVHRAGTLAKEYPLSRSQWQNCCHLKRKNTSTWSVLFAWSMPTKWYWVIHGRLTSERQASTSPSSFIVLWVSIPPLKRQAPCLLIHACMNQSSTVRFLAPTSALEQVSRSARERVTLSQAQIITRTRRFDPRSR